MEMSFVDVTVDFISRLGFPIFVSIYLLLKTSRETKALTDAINTLASKMD